MFCRHDAPTNRTGRRDGQITIVVEGFNPALSVIEKLVGRISADTDELDNTISQPCPNWCSIPKQKNTHSFQVPMEYSLKETIF